MGSAVVELVRTRSARGLTLVAAIAALVGASSVRAPHGARTPVTLVVVVDVSDSMNGGDKLARAKAAADRLIDELGPDDRLAIVATATRARTLIPLAAATDDARAHAHAAIAALTADGGTDLSDALVLGAQLVSGDAAARRLVMITDGEPTEGERDPAVLAALAARIASRGVAIETIDLR
jgi:Ca-activated chloride channel family protein